MSRRFFIHLLLLCLLPALSLSDPLPNAVKQSLQDNEQNNFKDGKSITQLPPERRAEVLNALQTYFSDVFQTPKDSREIKRLMAGLQGKSLPDEEERIFSPAPIKEVVAYYRFGKGTELPSENQLHEAFVKMMSLNGYEARKEATKQFVDQVSDSLLSTNEELNKAALVPIELKACPENGTRSQHVKAAILDGQLQKDFLLVGEEFPVSPSVAFGKDTFYLRYTTTPGDAMSAFFGRLGAPCLPFRMRTVGEEVKYYIGTDALKNFDSDPTGPGVMDATVKEFLARKGEN